MDVTGFTGDMPKRWAECDLTGEQTEMMCAMFLAAQQCLITTMVALAHYNVARDTVEGQRNYDGAWQMDAEPLVDNLASAMAALQAHIMSEVTPIV